jgi:hypothetical protein
LLNANERFSERKIRLRRPSLWLGALLVRRHQRLGGEIPVDAALERDRQASA